MRLHLIISAALLSMTLAAPIKGFPKHSAIEQRQSNDFLADFEIGHTDVKLDNIFDADLTLATGRSVSTTNSSMLYRQFDWKFSTDSEL